MKTLKSILAVTLFSLGLFAAQSTVTQDANTLSKNFEQNADCCGHHDSDDDA